MKSFSENPELHALGRHLERFGSVYVLVLFWLFYVLMLLDSGYVSEVEFSYDSSSYLRAANAIRHGHGFHDDAPAGGSGWFYWWPIGYPVLIAGIASVFRNVSIFLCAKILSFLMIGLLLFFFGRVFKKHAWVYALLLLNTEMVLLYRVSLSETVFVPLFFVFVFVLAEIMTKDAPPLRWYFFLYLCMCGLFLLRYFGIVATLFAGCAGLVTLVCCLRDRQNRPLRKKTALFALCGLATGLTEGGYLLLNARMAGFVPGISTHGQMTKIWELKAQLYDAFMAELTNILAIRESPLLDSFGIKAQRLLVFAIVAALLYLLYRYRKINYASLLIMAGLFYDLALVITLLTSETDTSGSRFLLPGTLLILAGLLSIATERFEGRGWRMAQRAAALLLALGVFSISYDWIANGTNPTAYAQMQEEVLKEFEEVPARSVILQHEASYRAPYRYFRTDVGFDGVIAPGDTPESLLARYAGYDHICISKKSAKKLLSSTDGSVTDEMAAYLQAFLDASAPGTQYLLLTAD